MTRRADADVVDGRQAAAVGEAQFAGAAEVDRVLLGHGATRAAVHAWRGGARVTKLAPASHVSILAAALSVSVWARLTRPLVQTHLRGHEAS